MPTANASPITSSAEQQSRARLQAEHEHLVLRQRYYTTLRFILNRRTSELDQLSLQCQTRGVVAIKDAEIQETYNEAILLSEHFNQPINEQSFHAIYGLLLRLKLRCSAKTPALTPKQINGNWSPSPSPTWINVHALTNSTGDRKIRPVPEIDKLRWTILDIERDLIGPRAGPSPHRSAPPCSYNKGLSLIKRTLRRLEQDTYTVICRLLTIKEAHIPPGTRLDDPAPYSLTRIW
jgi:hypothetical protein